MSSDSESDRNNGLITPKKTPKSTFKAPSNDRPKPIFIDEPKSFSTKKERGSRPIQPPPKPQAKTCPPVSRVFNRKLELTSTQKVTFLNKNETRRYESVQGTPLPSSKVYDSAKKVSYFEQAFKIEAKIGSGCFGNVYRVKSKEDGKQYAVKIAREVYRGEGDRISKLEEVRKHQVLLPHSNCVHFYQSWEEKGRLYQQFELCEGNLMELSETQHDIPESTIWAYLVDLLLAVEHLHDHGLIHMDIKPENIFLGREGICKLGDFGLVIDLAKEDTNHYEGDPRYLATEVLESRNFSKAADIFSLGVTILELACDLDLPKYGTLWHKLRDEGPNPSLTSKLSHDLRRVIQLMMTKHQDRRPTVKQLLALPSVKRAFEIRQRQLMVNHIISTFKNIFSPLVSIFILIWSCVIISPAMKVINIYKDWKEGYGHSTPTNTNTYERQDPFSEFYDEAELFKSPDQRPVVSSTDPTANFYIGDLTTNTNHLSFSSDDEDIDCSPLSRKFERSSSSSQHSALARPITLNFSDDEEIESSVEVNYCTTPASQYRNYNSETKSSKNTIELPDSSSAKKDAKKPKGKKSAFSFFSSEKSPEIKKEYPTLNKNAVTEELNKMWKSLDNEEKQKYNEMASKDEARFNDQTKAFQATTSNTVYKAAKDPNKPKQAKNPFMFFNAEFSLKIRAENPDSHMTVGEVAKAVSAKWQSLTDQEKQKYIEMAEKDKIRHEEEMKNYQAPPPVMVAVKDKNAPKAAKNAYSLFGADISAQIKSENGNLALSDKSKEISKRWKEADADTRRKYEELAAADKLRYENEMKDYKPSKQTKKKKKDPNMPKRNMASYMHFSVEIQKTMRKEHPEMSTTEITKAVGSQWKELNEEKRKKYEDIAVKDKKRFDEEMELYNAGKFIPTKQNNPDVNGVEDPEHADVENSE